MARIRKLKGAKCFLSPMTPDDAQQYAHWLNDMDVVQSLTLATDVINVENERKFIEQLADKHNYGIVTSDNEQLIGSCGFTNIDHIHQHAEIGIFIGDKNYWHCGYATQAMQLLIDYGFNYLNFHSIFLRVYSFNTHAIACYRKLGFTQIGRWREAIYRNQAFHDLIFMDILAADFYKNNKIQ